MQHYMLSGTEMAEVPAACRWGKEAWQRQGGSAPACTCSQSMRSYSPQCSRLLLVVGGAHWPSSQECALAGSAAPSTHVTRHCGRRWNASNTSSLRTSVFLHCNAISVYFLLMNGCDVVHMLGSVHTWCTRSQGPLSRAAAECGPLRALCSLVWRCSTARPTIPSSSTPPSGCATMSLNRARLQTQCRSHCVGYHASLETLQLPHTPQR